MKMSKDNLIPELRFPEFEKEGEWEEKKLGEIANILASGDLDGNAFSSMLTQTHIFPIYSNSVSKEGLYGYNSYSKYKPNSVTITARGTLGVAFVRNNDFVGIGRLLVVSDFNNIDSIFFKENWNHFAKVPLENGGIPQLTAIKAKTITLLYPKIYEQQKIASCLSSLDEVIAAHTQKLETLKDHKKGLMQNLFPQEGETVPKYRFPEFENDGEWVEKKLGDKEVSTFVNQKITIEKLNIDSYISTENMLPDFSGIKSASKLPLTGSFTKFIEGDVLISNIRPYLKKVWKSNKMGGASNDVFVFRSGSEVKNEYLEFILKNETFINYVMLSAKGVKMPRGDKDSMREYTVMVPSKEEQQKIASCLSSLDVIITEQVKKIAQLKLHKKGLMQGLFPKID